MRGLHHEPRLGVAGWSIPRIHDAHFPAEGSHLGRYASVFRCVEINSSFYRPHRRSTYERWSASTPEGFKFSVKAPKSVTHTTALSTADLDRFSGEIAGLGQKLGPVLIQLPPKRSFDAEDALPLLSAFRSRVHGPIVLEPRHASWFLDEAEKMLLAFEIGRVAADPARAKGADRPGGWGGLVYYRLHGSPDIYNTSYNDGRLERIAERLRIAAGQGAEVWCIFDNTASYAAVGDALALRERMRN